MKEFYFADENLEKTINGKRLLLRPRKIRQHIDALSLPLPEIESHEPHHRQIVPDSKKHFAEEVVPSFPPSAFGAFDPLFKAIQKAFEELEKARLA